MDDLYQEAIVLTESTKASWEYVLGTTRSQRQSMFRAAEAVAEARNNAVERARVKRR